MTRHLLFVLGIAACSTNAGAEERTLDAVLAGWGTDLSNIQLVAETLEPGLHVIRGAGGAVVVSIGEDGVLVVDDQFAATVPLLKQQIEMLGGGDVHYVVNTHWHYDHADGNPQLGAEGARIVAHERSREQMMRQSRLDYAGYYYLQPPYPAEGLPQITFSDSLTLHFNGQRIDVAHFGPAHTTGDAVVYFREANVAHVGDLYSAGYPYLDAPNGGGLAGLIAVTRAIIDWIDEDARVVSGHSPIADMSDLHAYAAMLEATHEAIRGLIEDGKTLDEVLAADVTAPFNDARGNPRLFVTMAYRSMTR